MSGGLPPYGREPDGPHGSPSGDPDGEETFAELVNGFTFGSGRRKRGRKNRQREESAAPPAPDGASSGGWPVVTGNPPGGAYAHVPPEPDLYDEPELAHEDDAAIVRPYAWTGGRTKSSIALQLETLVSTTDVAKDPSAVLQAEHRAVADLCIAPRSVAEVAALLGVPLGIAKVLIGDMANLDMLAVHLTAVDGDASAQLMLMERVLSGLRRL